jgi:hypothetical protein
MRNSHVGRRSALALLAGASLSVSRFGFASLGAQAARAGFIGELDFRVNEVGGEVLFELRNDFGYIDSTGRRWQAKKGLLTDGASIPSVFWPILGHPFQGLYLKPAVIHDYYCIPKNRYRRWENVHRVFYDAMLNNGVGRAKALAMYFAVWRFGPRWNVSEIKPCTPGPNEFCASAQVSEYRVHSEQVVSFDRAQEEVRLREFQELAEADRIQLQDVPRFESALPSLTRTQVMVPVDASSDDGWYFGNPYEFPLPR